MLIFIDILRQLYDPEVQLFVFSSLQKLHLNGHDKLF